MADRLFDIANSAARRLGDMFGVVPGASLDRPELYPSDQPRPDLLGATANGAGDRPNFFGGAQSRPDFFGNAAGSVRPDFYSQPAGFSFWDYAAQHQAATNPSTIQGQGVPLGGGVAVGAGIAGSPSSGMKPGVARWAGQAQQTFGDLGADMPDVMLAIMTNESGGDPNAYNASGDAWGLFQQLHLNSKDPGVQFQAARQLAQEKLAGVEESYRRNGLNPDQRTRARDFALAWAGHFDYGTGQPNPSSRDIGSGQTADQLASIFLANYDGIKAGRQQPAAGGPGRQSAQGAIARAQGLLGTPYELGGLRTHPGVPNAGLDCSELTGYALGLDSSLWNAQSQYDHAQKLDPSQAQAGDLVFFTGTDPSNNQPITHVGLYIGNGQMIDAEDGGVLVANLNSQYWQSHLAGYGRL